MLRRSTAGVWSVNTFAPTLNGAVGVTATTAYAAGNYGAFAQLVSGAWQSQFQVAGSYTYFGRLYAPSATVLYGARFAGVYSYASGSWLPSYEPLTTGWRAVGGTGPTDMFAGGNSGILARFVSSWTAASPNPLATTDVVLNIRGAPGAPIFAVGTDASGNGFIQRFSANTWTRMTLPTTAAIRDVSVVDATNAFAVGSGGTILRFNGTSWTAVTSGTTVTLRSVWAASATEAYAVGDAGTILRWDGTSWSAMASGTTFNLGDVSGVSGSYAIAVGEAMTVVTGRPTLAASIASVRSTPPSMPSGMRVGPVQAVAPDPFDLRLGATRHARGTRPSPR